MDTDDTSTKVQLDLARQLVAYLEAGEEDQASAVIRQLRIPHERELFDELGKLTRDLHEALNSFRGDSRLVELTRDEIPDAKERLNYVVTMTEQATHRTLNAIDEAMPVAETLHSGSLELAERWARFRNRDLSVDEFRDLARDLDDHFAQAGAETERLRSLISEIMMAQDFQDLTGQIIRRVIRLVHEVEENLVGLIRLSSAKMEPAQQPTKAVKEKTAETVDQEAVGTMGHGPVVPNTVDAAADVVSGQDDVDALLSSLGF